jgi:PAS domain S-box-containing protein
MDTFEKEEGKTPPAGMEWTEAVDATGDAMLVVDNDFNIVKVNKALVEMVAPKVGSIEGKKCFAVMHGRAEPPSSCAHVECARRRLPVTKRFFEPHLGLELLISISLVKDAEGGIKGSFHVIRDVTGSVEALSDAGNRITVETLLAGRLYGEGARITKRQREVLLLLAQGHPVKRIGPILGISKKTVEFHKYSMMKYLGVKSVAELIRVAIREKIIAP